MQKTLVYSLKRSLPILVAFIPVGLAYGVLMQNAGYNAFWIGLCCLLVNAGSLQFLMVSFFTSSMPLLKIAIMALLINSRHIFYGLPFIEKFNQFGPSRYFLIYYLSDENFSLHCAYNQEDGVNEKSAYIITTALVVFYWFALSLIGIFIGSLITIDMTGVDFAMTALFTVILVEQIRGATNKLPVLVAAISSILCLAVIGPDSFILPSLAITVTALILLKKSIEPKKEDA